MKETCGKMVALLRRELPTHKALASRFCPPAIDQFRRKHGLMSLREVVARDYPALRDVAQSHGFDSAIDLISLYLVNLNDAVNIQRMSDEQIHETAGLIYDECPAMKLTELFEFFRRVKAGEYGEFYGSIDCVKLMCDFRAFLRHKVEAEKANALQEKKRREAVQEWMKKATEEQRAEFVAGLDERTKIELSICPDCGGLLIDGRAWRAKKCISCEFKTGEYERGN